MLGTYFATLKHESAPLNVFLVEMAGISPAIDAVFDQMLMNVGDIIIATLDPERRGALVDSPFLYGAWRLV